MTLSRNEILNALDLPTEEVEIPRWGGTVLVRAMPMASTRYTLFIEKGGTGKNPIPERERFMRQMVGAVILSTLDGDSEKRLFEWSDASDLREKHWNSVLKVANKAFDLASDDPDDDDDELVEHEIVLEADDIVTEDEDTPEVTPETDEDAPDPPKEG